jgi:hypothetical protein
LLKIQNCKFLTSADLQHFRIRTLLIFHNPVTERARHAAESGITPAKPGSAQAPLASRARHVKNFHCSFHHGIAKIQNCKFLTSADLQHFRVRTLLIFHNPVTERALGGSFAARAASPPDSPTANRQARGT